MRKNIASLAVLLAFVTFRISKQSYDREFIIKAGVLPQTKVHLDQSGNKNTNIGFSGGVEFFQYFGNVFAFDGGTTVNSLRKIKNLVEDYSLSLWPFYLRTKIRIPVYRVKLYLRVSFREVGI